MAKYTIRITETAAYILDVEAETPEEAKLVAENMFVSAPNVQVFYDSVDDREIEIVLTDDA